MTKSRGLIIALLVFAITAALWLLYFQRSNQQVVNLLLWSGYDDPVLLDTFSNAHDIRINYKTFVGGDSMFALLSQSKGQYDVVVVDPEYIPKLLAADRLAPLDRSGMHLSEYADYFHKFPLAWNNEEMYAVPVEFGSLALVYNTEVFTGAEVESYDVLYSDKAKNRVGVWDWYLPIMGVLSLSIGNRDPYNISDEQFQELTRELGAFRPQVRAIHPNFPDLLGALANNETVIVPGGAEWAASALQQQGKPYDWAVPAEGGVMWVDSLAIPRDAPNPDAAQVFVNWMTGPEAQAILSQKPAFHALVPNLRAYELMPPEHLKRLKIHEPADDIARLVEQLVVRELPVQQPEARWQSVWQQFKAGSLRASNKISGGENSSR